VEEIQSAAKYFDTIQFTIFKSFALSERMWLLLKGSGTERIYTPCKIGNKVLHLEEISNCASRNNKTKSQIVG